MQKRGPSNKPFQKFSIFKKFFCCNCFKKALKIKENDSKLPRKATEYSVTLNEYRQTGFISRTCQVNFLAPVS